MKKKKKQKKCPGGVQVDGIRSRGCGRACVYASRVESTGEVWRLEAVRQLESGRRPHEELASPLCSDARPVPLSVLGRPCVRVTRSVGSTGDAAPRLRPSEARGCVTQGRCSVLSPAGPLLRYRVVCRNLRERHRRESWAHLSNGASLKQCVWHAVLPFMEPWEGPWGGRVSVVRGHSGWDRQRALQQAEQPQPQPRVDVLL